MPSLEANVLLAINALFLGVVGALGAAVRFLFRELNALRVDATSREALCETRLNLSKRRQAATWNKLIEVAGRAGVPVNGPYADEVAAIDAEEARLLEAAS